MRDFMVFMAALAIVSMAAVCVTQAKTYDEPKSRIIKVAYHE